MDSNNARTAEKTHVYTIQPCVQARASAAAVCELGLSCFVRYSPRKKRLGPLSVTGVYRHMCIAKTCSRLAAGET